MMVRAILLALFASTTQAAAPPTVQTIGQLTSPRLTETSGIARSNRDPAVLWGVNDSGHAPLLHAFSADGSNLGSVVVNQARNHDWEDLSSFVLNGKPYLLIADTGDNSAIRKTSLLLIVAEPRANRGRFAGEVNLVARVPFRYEDGPRDCEAVAVDVSSDRVLLVTKGEVPAAVYELPLTLVPGIVRPLVARKIATLDTLPQPTLKELLQAPLLGPWQHQPTAMDISPDGGAVAVITYRNIYFFAHSAQQGWDQSLSAAPRVLPLPRLNQAESVAFAGDRVIVIPEGRSAPVLSIGPIPR